MKKIVIRKKYNKRVFRFCNSIIEYTTDNRSTGVRIPLAVPEQVNAQVAEWSNATVCKTVKPWVRIPPCAPD